MARYSIDKARTRARLEPRREPYWGAPLARGLFLGFRKLDDGGTWIARWRDDDGRQHYLSIGHADSIPYDDAVLAAHAFVKAADAGVDTSEVQTVTDACKAYVEDRRREKGKATADDAAGRFRRDVYRHAIGKIKLTKLRSEHVKQWRAGLAMGDGSANRMLATLKAALNFAVASRYVEAGRAIEWASVKAHKVSARRTLYLDAKQRHALVAALPEYAQPFARALCLLPLRPGALARAVVADLDTKRASMRIVHDKAGAGRTIALSPDALALLRDQAKGKLPAAPLVARPDGAHWLRWDWAPLIREAAGTANLPGSTCAYTIRHSVITDMLVGGIDPLTVARMAGTSLVMIERHYGHLLHDHAAKAMAALAL